MCHVAVQADAERRRAVKEKKKAAQAKSTVVQKVRTLTWVASLSGCKRSLQAARLLRTHSDAAYAHGAQMSGYARMCVLRQLALQLPVLAAASSPPGVHQAKLAADSQSLFHVMVCRLPTAQQSRR
jgi:hypothetical protein